MNENDVFLNLSSCVSSIDLVLLCKERKLLYVVSCHV